MRTNLIDTEIRGHGYVENISTDSTIVLMILFTYNQGYIYALVTSTRKVSKE